MNIRVAVDVTALEQESEESLIYTQLDSDSIIAAMAGLCDCQLDKFAKQVNDQAERLAMMRHKDRERQALRRNEKR